MKKNLILLLLAAFAVALTAFAISNTKSKVQPTTDIQNAGCYNSNVPLPEMPGPVNYVIEPDFLYRIGNRFNATVTMNQIKKAKTIIDLLPPMATNGLSDFRTVRIDTLPNKKKTALIGKSEVLNTEQKSILAKMKISSNFFIRSNCKEQKADGLSAENYDLVYYQTVVPETPAFYNEGMDAIYHYLRENTAELMSLANRKKLTAGKISFTISEKGKVINALTEASCAFEEIDVKVLELIKNMPGNWTPAKNENGQLVKQEFVLFYSMEGC